MTGRSPRHRSTSCVLEQNLGAMFDCSIIDHNPATFLGCRFLRKREHSAALEFIQCSGDIPIDAFHISIDGSEPTIHTSAVG